MQTYRSREEKILFVGIGNVLRCDDGVGVYIARQIGVKKNLDSLVVEVSIENYIQKINRLNPGLLVLIDTVHFGREPGYSEIRPVDDIRDYIINTHNISLKRVTEFFHMPVYILGIQPGNLSIGERLTTKVKKTADRLIEEINAL